MTKAIFNPEWKSFPLVAITEGDGVNVATNLVVRATVSLAPNEREILLDATDLAALTSVIRDGEIVSFTTLADRIRLPGVNRTSIVILMRSASVSYTAFAGSLPPGLAITSNGHIRGVVGNIASKAPKVYRFGLRASYGGKTADVIREWTALPADQTIAWNYATLPIPTLDMSRSPKPYYSMGEFRRGQTVDIGVDISNPDDTPLDVLIRIPAINDGVKVFKGVLPMGLSLTNNPFAIVGFIPAEALPGDYFVELYVDEPLPLDPIVVHFRLLGDSFDQFTAINKMVWNTPTALGSFKEGQRSDITLSATQGDNAVLYALAPGSRALPFGLTLSSSGEIRGRFPHVATETSFDIIVKATSGRYVALRTFRFSIKRTFVTGRNVAASLLVSGDRKLSLRGPAATLTNHYRPMDPNFQPSSSVSIIRGLRANPLNDFPYGKPITLLLGEYRLAQVIRNGAVLYDVIYRPLIDPMERAGGFVAGTNSVIPQVTTYPQNPSIKIADSSINNFRRDLVQHLGLDSDSQKLIEGELLPEWQTDFEAVSVVAYLEPNTGKRQLAGITYGNAPVGTQIKFDRLLLDDGTNSSFYYLGYDNNDPTNIAISLPLAPYDLRIDGVPAETATARYLEPTITWTQSELDVVYQLDIYSADILLRSEEIDGTAFRYSASLQAVDGTPGYVRFVLTARRGENSSPPITGNALSRAGWGRSWGFRYGGLA